MAFNYRTLISQVRRMVNDSPKLQVDSIASTSLPSYFIIANQDAYITPAENGIIIDGTILPSGQYTVTKNIIKSSVLINAGSSIAMQYNSVTYTDDMIADMIGDTIHNTIEPIFNTDFGFVGEDTSQDIDNDLRALFVYGTAILIQSDKLNESGNDAIYIRDGDTVIVTATGNREKARAYEPLQKKWETMLLTIRLNRFNGVTMV